MFALKRLFVAPHVLDEEGTDPAKRPVAADDRRPAPVGMGGGGEDRLVEEVLPVPRELALEDDLRGHRLRCAPVPGEDDEVAPGEGIGGPEGEPRDRKPLEGLHETEPRLLIIGDDVGRDGGVLVVDEATPTRPP